MKPRSHVRWLAPVTALGLTMVLAACPARPPRTTTTTTTYDPTAPTTEPTEPGEGSLPDAAVEGNGPFAVTVDGNAGAGSTVFRPTNLGQGGVKHPIFVWGTGATSTPAQYRDHFSRMASHGFVIISPNTGSVTAGRLTQSLNWIVAQNSAAGIYNGKLNTSKIAMGGHSLGSTSTFDAERTATNLTTTIHIAGGSFDGQGSSKVKTPTAYICGSTDFALTNCQRDYQNMRAGGQPLFFSVMQGVDHIQAARRALPAMIAWLRWHLAGENRKAEFSPGGKFFSGIFRSQVKNWN